MDTTDDTKGGTERPTYIPTEKTTAHMPEGAPRPQPNVATPQRSGGMFGTRPVGVRPTPTPERAAEIREAAAQAGKPVEGQTQARPEPQREAAKMTISEVNPHHATNPHEPKWREQLEPSARLPVKEQRPEVLDRARGGLTAQQSALADKMQEADTRHRRQENEQARPFVRMGNGME